MLNKRIIDEGESDEEATTRGLNVASSLERGMLHSAVIGDIRGCDKDNNTVGREDEKREGQ